MIARIRALGVGVQVDGDLGASRTLEEALAHFPSDDGPGPAALQYVVERADDRRLRLLLPEGLERVDDAPGTLLHLFRHLTRAVVDRTDAIVVHAGAVVVGGQAVLLPGRMEAGKSTLTAALVRAGCGYLTDEAAGLWPESIDVHPFPRPIGLDRGAQDLFPELAPEHRSLAAGPEAQWQVPPTLLGPGRVSGPAPAALIVFPRFEAGTPARLESLTRAEALVELAHLTFHFDRRATEALDVLAGAVRASSCYRLTGGSLDDAVASVLSAAGASGSGIHRS